MSKAKFDPLEAAKIPVVGDVPAPAVAPPVAPTAPTPAPEVAAAPRSKTPVVPPPVACKKYRVVATTRFSSQGQLTTLHAGAILDAAGYGGEPGIARMIADGIKLEAVED